ncbi:hypothetical protein HOD08_01250 [bacterium]|nr:hypothetical protein [bacterium]
MVWGVVPSKENAKKTDLSVPISPASSGPQSKTKSSELATTVPKMTIIPVPKMPEMSEAPIKFREPHEEEETEFDRLKRSVVDKCIESLSLYETAKEGGKSSRNTERGTDLCQESGVFELSCYDLWRIVKSDVECHCYCNTESGEWYKGKPLSAFNLSLDAQGPGMPELDVLFCRASLCPIALKIKNVNSLSDVEVCINFLRHRALQWFVIKVEIFPGDVCCVETLRLPISLEMFTKFFYSVLLVCSMSDKILLFDKKRAFKVIGGGGTKFFRTHYSFCS